MKTITNTTDRRGIVPIRLNRPDRRNAFDAAMIAELTHAFSALGDDPAIRAVLLSGAGKAFCAGADLNWMKAAAAQGPSANKEDAEKLADLMAAVNRCPVPVIGLVHGACFGGGVGLASCCDMVVATEDARFALSEVRLGLIPAAISPYVVAAIGQRHARRLFLTAERFSANTAHKIGLAHEVAADLPAATARAEALIQEILLGGPAAIRDAKALLADIDACEDAASLRAMTAARIAARRASAEGQEGLSAFLEKRPPAWINPAGGEAE